MINPPQNQTFLQKYRIFVTGRLLWTRLNTRKMNRIIGKIGLGLMGLIFVSLALFPSCRKEGETVARIMVVDTAGDPFSNAMVRLYPSPTIDEHGAIVIDDTSFTEVDGYAVFDFSDSYNLGQAGVFVLDIEVRSGDTLYGEGIIKIEQEETSEETVIIQ